MDTRLHDAIITYTAPSIAHELITSHPSLNIAGPTGAGKGTVAIYLMQTGNYAPVISDTTRLPRLHNDGYEVNGVQYWFLNEAEALRKVEAGAYIEVKAVHQQTMYGTSIEAYQRVIANGRTPLLEIDVQGNEELMQIFDDFESLFLLPPDFETWQHRLDGRGSMDLEQKTRRLGTALLEIDRLLGNDRFHPVINREVIDTAEIIISGGYKNADYRAEALAIAKSLQIGIRDFLKAKA